MHDQTAERESGGGTSGRWGLDLAPAAAAALVSVLLAVSILGLWRTGLRTPIGWAGDGLLHMVMAKATAEQGWPLTVDRLGAPGRLDFRDFPALDNLSLAMIRLLSLGTADAGLLINLFFLATFPLIAASAFLSSRRLGLSRAASFIVSILYALLPYHFIRGTGHLFLSAYYLVPPAILAAFVLADRPEGLRGRALVPAIVLCLALGSATVYYAFFAAIFFAVGGISGALAHRSRRPLALGAALIAVILVTLFVNHLPTIVKEAREGSLNVATRWPAEAELYGLKIAQLVLPLTEHRLGPLAALKRRYDAAPLVTENETATLGGAGTCGFVLLMIWLLYVKPRGSGAGEGHRLLNHFSVMTAVAVLFGTIGGLSSLFSLLVSPQIRSVNRISVFIAFTSLVAAGVAFDFLLRNRGRATSALLAALITAGGVADQTNSNFRHAPSGEPQRLAAWIGGIERRLPPGSLLFQLPYFQFPENGPIHGMGDYDHFRPYLMSESLRFSYGAVRGSRADLWQRHVSGLEAREMTRTLALAGFGGVVIERTGLPDAAALERTLAVAAGAVPFADEEGRRSFVDLTALRSRLGAELGPRFPEEAEDARHPLLIGWRGGFYGEERVEGERWHWAGGDGELLFHAHPREATAAFVTMKVAAADAEPATLRIRSDFWNEDIPLSGEPVAVNRRLVIPPGSHRVAMETDAEVVTARRDARRFVFRVIDFAAVPERARAGAAAGGVR